MADLSGIAGSVTRALTSSLVTRYPSNLGQKPFDKWVCFEARAGRHVLRDKVVPEKSTGTDRTLGSVGLYMDPAALKDSITLSYDTQALGPFIGTAVELLAQSGQNLFDTRFNTMQDAANATATLFNNITGAASATALTIGSSFVEAIKTDLLKLASSVTSGEAVSAVTGQKVNPKTDVLFDTNEYRKHSYTFLMIPRNLSEAKAIDSIVSFFQFYSLPIFRRNQSGQGGSFIIGFPYEFVITFRDEQGRELNHVNKVARSVLTTVGVDHAAGGKTAFIKNGDEFYPVATRLQLDFQEVVLLDRDSDQIKRPGSAWTDPRK
jgi:hypothetical protein